MVDRVHRGTTHLRATAHVALASRLAELDVLVIGVAEATDRRHAVDVDAAQFARRHHHDGVVAFASHELRAAARRAADLTATADLELDVVDLQADRHVREAHRVARLRLRVGAGHQRLPDLEAEGREDVALLAVRVVQQRDVRRAVRIVFDRRHARGHAELVALEVDHAVAALRTTTTTANR